MNGSILYMESADYTDFGTDGFYHDLRIDAVLSEIAGPGGIDEQYYRKPSRLADVQFRLDIMRDLERPDIREIIETFLNRYGQYQTYLGYASDLPQRQTRQKWFLDAAQAYCECLAGLQYSLREAAPESQGLRRFFTSLDEYMKTEEFLTLRNDGELCAGRLNAVRYTLDVWLSQSKVTVRADSCGEDYCARLMEVFRRFDLADCPRMVPFPGVNMESLELVVLERLRELFGDEFKMLDEFCACHTSIGARLVDSFAEELRFYRSYISVMDRMREKGCAFSYPVFHKRRSVEIAGGYDLSLALAGGTRITPNDFQLQAGESCIITGPNQGGKTACLRTVGQIIYFASLGLPVPCRSAAIYFVEGIFTHFAREEDPNTNFGRLKEELQRAKHIIDSMPPASMVLFNDLFSSTTAFDAAEIGRLLLGNLAARGCLCLFATNLPGLGGESHGILRLHAAPTESQEYRVTREPACKALPNLRMTDYRLRREDIRRRVR